MSKLLFVVNSDVFFISHRLPIALEAMRLGYEVHVATKLSNKQNFLCGLGLIVHPLDLSRCSLGIISNGYIFFQLLSLYKKIKPDIVHLVTIKPVILGGLAARLMHIPCLVVAISGLGFVFVSRGSVAKICCWLISILYNLVFSHKNIKVIFQNVSDKNHLIKLTELSEKKVVLIRGSGVDLLQYRPMPLPTGVPIIMFAARLLINKGVCEFIQAARLLKKGKRKLRFVLVGEPDLENPASVSINELTQWATEGIVENWGYCSNMPKVLASAHIVVLPSYYGEGLPKVLIEAAACGRATITTDHPGCRDAVEPGISGMLVPIRNVKVLVSAIKQLLDNPRSCLMMGKAGRVLAEQAFDIRQVVKKHMQIYKRLIAKT